MRVGKPTVIKGGAPARVNGAKTTNGKSAPVGNSRLSVVSVKNGVKVESRLSAVVDKTTAAKSSLKNGVKIPVKLVAKGTKIVADIAPVVKDLPIEEFFVGDKVVYPAHGVGAIDSIQLRSVSGSDHKFYMITILETGMKIMVPLAQVGTVGLRRVVDSKTIEKVYDILRDRDVEIDSQTWNRRYREYTQKIKTGSVFEIAKVIRDLSVLKGDKELSFGERKMLDTAQGLLVKEISIAKSRSEDMVKAELAELFQPALGAS